MKYAAMVMLACLATACEAQNTHLHSETVIVRPIAGEAMKVEVEIAQTDEERAIGLMNRKSMAEMHGMLFVWPEARHNVFWMKDTLIPLDMMFIKDGKVVAIAPMAKPMDETPVDPGLDSDRVLEMNGGWASAHGVTLGAELVEPSR